MLEIDKPSRGRQSKSRKSRRAESNLFQQAYYSIREKILSGELAFGTPLSRPILARELGMSILPVSQALQQLENEGLIESRPRVGTRVRTPTPQDVRDHYVVREALECHAARLFAEKASVEERDEIQEMALELDRAWPEINRDHRYNSEDLRDHAMEVRRLHMRFHMRIAECTGSPGLCRAIEKNQILVFHWLYEVALRDFTLPPHWHAELAAALCSGDRDQACEAMRIHVRKGLDRYLKRLDLYLSGKIQPAHFR